MDFIFTLGFVRFCVANTFVFNQGRRMEDGGLGAYGLYSYFIMSLFNPWYCRVLVLLGDSSNGDLLHCTDFSGGTRASGICICVFIIVLHPFLSLCLFRYQQRATYYTIIFQLFMPFESRYLRNLCHPLEQMNVMRQNARPNYQCRAHSRCSLIAVSMFQTSLRFISSCRAMRSRAHWPSKYLDSRCQPVPSLSSVKRRAMAER